MLVKYSYKCTDGFEFGDYQCDVDDFWNWFDRENSRVACIVVKKQDGDVWIWSQAMKECSEHTNGFIRQERGGQHGWQKVFEGERGMELYNSPPRKKKSHARIGAEHVFGDL